VTVRCPACGTLYRRPGCAARDAPTFRCVRCGHVFDALPDEPEGTPPDGEAPVEAEEAFTDTDDDTERFTFGDADDVEDEETGEGGPPAAEPPAEDTPRRGASPARFAARMLVVVTLGYAILSAYLYTHVDATYRMLADVPVIGPRMVERRLSPAVVQLAGVRGEYLRVKGDQLVFAVTGTVVNGATIPVRGIRVEGWVSGAADVRHAVTVGARPRQIGDLSLREIGLLQSLEPPNTWSLPPGETIDFLIVFPEPAEDLKEFGARVVSVRAGVKS
jgi:rubredoxin